MTAFIVTGCGMFGGNGKTPTTSMAFQNRTSDMLVTPDAKLDPTIVQNETYRAISVVNSSGHPQVIHVGHQPVLFVAYWCPHCQRTLQLLTEYRAKFGVLPIIVCVGYSNGTSLSAAVRVERQEERVLHLAHFSVYYALASTAGNRYAPEGYPTLVYRDKGELKTLYGEHSLAIWEQVLHGEASA